jgi:hypothetical protein
MDFNLRFAFAITATLLLSSCGSGNDLTPVTVKKEILSAGAAAPCASGLAAFEKNLYLPILRSKCIDCHDKGGIGPAHSTADPIASYNMIKTYVNFAELSQSRIIQHVQIKHWVNYDASETGCSVSDITTALQNWWDQGEKACPSSDTAQTATALIPAQLPLFPQESFVPMTWKLDALGDAFVGAEFQVEIQQLAIPTSTSAGAYRLRKPRIATTQQGLAVEGIHFFVNGKAQDNANGWEHLGAQIAGHEVSGASGSTASFDGAPVLSGREIIALQDQASGDTLSVTFSGIQVIAKPLCKNLTVFQTKILPVIQQSTCIGCHQGGAASNFNGSSKLLLTGPDVNICGAVRERADFSLGEPSPFVEIGFLQANDHPPVDQLPQTFNQDWQTWISGENP